MFWYGKVLPAITLLGALGLFLAPEVQAQTAGNLKCNGCVNSKDIKNNKIKSKDIKDGQVKNPDLANGAVTRDKIAPGAIGPDDIFQRTLVVSPVGDGSDATANGQALLDAVGFFDTVSPPPSDTTTG